MVDEIERIIVKNLFTNERYAKEVSPFVEKKYAEESVVSDIYLYFREYISQYQSLPTIDNFVHYCRTNKKTNDVQVEKIKGYLKDVKNLDHDEFNHKSLVDLTEQHFQVTHMGDVVLKAAKILDSKDRNGEKHALPEMFRDALKLSFKNTVGVEYLSDQAIEEQFDFYHANESRLNFTKHHQLNTKLRGGLKRKSMNIILAGTNVGKTLWLADLTADLSYSGFNGLYISLEIDEHEINERIDANLLDTESRDLKVMSKPDYLKRIDRIKAKKKGRIFVKQFPTASANVNHIRTLLDELELKHDFVPDFISVDYMNIMQGLRYNNMGDSYNYVKAIAEELRGLAVEKDVAILTATQSKREANTASDMSIDDVSESFGTAHTADLILGVIQTEDMKERNQFFCRIIKTRYAPNIASSGKFYVGVNLEKQQLSNIIDVDASDGSGSPIEPDKKSTKKKWKV